MTTDLIINDLQKSNPSAVIELFELQLIAAIHNSTAIYRFCSHPNGNNNQAIIWGGNTYTLLPIRATGFAYQKGQLPRPVLHVSNALGTITAILLNVNAFNPGCDLTGAVVTRVTTLVKFLDAANWDTGTNPYGTPDPTAKFPDEKYVIQRKAGENREVVEFELGAALDLAGVRAPKRQCTRAEFPSIGTYV